MIYSLYDLVYMINRGLKAFIKSVSFTRNIGKYLDKNLLQETLVLSPNGLSSLDTKEMKPDLYCLNHLLCPKN